MRIFNESDFFTRAQSDDRYQRIAPPSAPTDLAFVSTSVSTSGTEQFASITFSFTAAVASGDDNAIASYTAVYTHVVDSLTVTETASIAPGGPYTIANLELDTTYTMGLQAVDSYGQVSALSNTFSQASGLDTTPPATPSISGNLVTGGVQIVVATLNTEPDFRYYQLLRKETTESTMSDGSDMTPIAQFTGTVFTDDLIPASTQFWYRVQAVDLSGNVSTSAQAGPFTLTITVIAPPPTPTLVSAAAQVNGSVIITWDTETASNQVIAYRIWRRITVTPPATVNLWEELNSVQADTNPGDTSQSYTDANTLNATAYDYTVSAINVDDVESAYGTATVSATASYTTAPAPPTNLVFSSGLGQITAAWTPVSNPPVQVLYGVSYRDNSGDAWGAEELTPSASLATYGFTDTRDDLAGALEFQVRTVDIYGNGSSYINGTVSFTDLLAYAPADGTIPPAPSFASQVAKDDGSITISFPSVNVPDIAGYNITRRINIGGATGEWELLSQMADATQGTKQYTDYGLEPYSYRGTTYDYALYAMDTAGNISRLNLVLNSSFESGATSWTWVGGTGTTTSATSRSGSSCAVVGNGISITQTVAATAGLAYSLSAYFEQVSTSTTASITLQFLDSSSSNVGSAQSATGVTGPSFSQVTLPDIVAPINTVYVQFSLGTTGSATAYLDDVQLEQATTVSPYGDGKLYGLKAVDNVAPTPAVDLVAGGVLGGIQLQWDNGTGVSYIGSTWEIWRCATSSGTYSKVAEVAGTDDGSPVVATDYYQIVTTTATTFYYQLKIADRWGNESGFLNTPVSSTSLDEDTAVTPPSEPASVTAVDNHDLTVTVGWAAAARAAQYGIWRESGGSAWELVNRVNSSATSYIDDTVVNATAYTYTVSTISVGGVESAYGTATASVTPAYTSTPAAPSAVTLQGGLGCVAVAWTPGAAPTNPAVTVAYTVSYSLTPTGSVVATEATAGATFTIYGLQASRSSLSGELTISVAALDNFGNASSPSTATATATQLISYQPADGTAPAAPSSLSSVASTNGSVTLSFVLPSTASVPDLAGYQITRRENTGGVTGAYWESLAVVQNQSSGSTVYYSDYGLEPYTYRDTTYDYEVYSIDTGGNISTSPATVLGIQALVTAALAPVPALTAYGTLGGVGLAWRNGSGASYIDSVWEIWRSSTSGGSYSKIQDAIGHSDGSLVTATDNYGITYTASSTYYYELYLRDRWNNVSGPFDANTAGASLDASGTLLSPIEPTGISATNNANLTVTVGWTAVGGAANYSIWRQSGAAAWEFVDRVDAAATSYLDTSVSVASYTYTVGCTSPLGLESAYGTNTATISATYTTAPAAPTGLSFTGAGLGFVGVGWTPVAAPANPQVTLLYKVSATSPTIAAVEVPGSAYTFYGLQSSQSALSGAMTVSVQTVDSFGNASTAVTAVLPSATAASYQPTSTAPPAAPSSLSLVSNTNGVITLSFVLPSSVSVPALWGYEIDRRSNIGGTTGSYWEDATDNQNQSNGATITWNDVGLEPYTYRGTTYDYRVSTVDQAGNISASPAVLSGVEVSPSGVLAPSPGLAAAGELGSISLSWVNGTGIGYVDSTWELWRCATPTGTYTKLTDVVGAADGHPVTYQDNYEIAFNAASTFYYELFVRDQYGNRSGPFPSSGGIGATSIYQDDDLSAPATTTGLTAGASSLVAVANGYLAVQPLSWTANTESDLDHYEIEYWTGTGSTPGATVFSITAGSDATSISVAGLLPNSDYGYRIRAWDSWGNFSGWSTAVTALTAKDTTPPAIPTLGSIAPSLRSIQVTISPANSEADFSYYTWYRGTSSTFSASAVIASGPNTALTDGAVTQGTTYYYWATATNTSASSSSHQTSPLSGTPGQVLSTDIGNSEVTTPAIAANAVTTQKLSVVNRAVVTQGVTFTPVVATNTISWTSGSLVYEATTYTTSAGSVTYAGTAQWLYFDPSTSTTAIQTSTVSPSSGSSPFGSTSEAALVGMYQGGGNWSANTGETSIDGGFIQAGTVTAETFAADALTVGGGTGMPGTLAVYDNASNVVGYIGSFGSVQLGGTVYGAWFDKLGVGNTKDLPYLYSSGSHTYGYDGSAYYDMFNVVRSSVSGVQNNLCPDSALKFGWTYWIQENSGATIASQVGGDGGNALQLAIGSAAVGAQTISFGVVAGATYTLSAWIDTSAMTAGSAYVQAYLTSTTPEVSVVHGTVGSRVSVTFTVPSGVTAAFIEVGQASSPAGTALISCIQIEYGTAMTAYRASIGDNATGYLKAGSSQIDFGSTIHLNKTLDNIPAGSIYTSLPITATSGTLTATKVNLALGAGVVGDLQYSQHSSVITGVVNSGGQIVNTTYLDNDTTNTIGSGHSRAISGLSSSGAILVGTAATSAALLDSGASRANTAINSSNNLVTGTTNRTVSQIEGVITSGGGLNVSPSGGVSNTLPYSNHAIAFQGVVSSAGILNVSPTAGVANTLPYANHASAFTSIINPSSELATSTALVGGTLTLGNIHNYVNGTIAAVGSLIGSSTITGIGKTSIPLSTIHDRVSSTIGSSTATGLDNVNDGSTYVRLASTHASGNVAYNYKGVWSSTTAYVVGDEAVYGTSYWVCTAANTNTAPAAGGTDWQVVGTYSGYQGAWSSTTSYVAGAEVTYSSNYWVCLVANANSAPTTSNSNWQVAGPASLDNIADGSTYYRTTLNQRNGAGYAYTGLNSSGNLTTGTTNRTVAQIEGVVASGGGISATAIVSGRTEGIGTSLGLLNSSGQLLTADDIAADGTVHGRVLLAGLSSGYASTTYSGSATHNIKGVGDSQTLSLDSEIADGTTYARPRAAGMSSGYVVKTGSSGTYTIKGVGDANALDLDTDVANGTNYLRSPAHTNSANIAPNPNFDASTNLPPAGWINGGPGTSGSATLSWDTATPYQGSQSLVVNGPGDYCGVVTAPFAVAPGQQYKISGALKYISGSGGQISLWIMNASGAELLEVELSNTSNTNWVFSTAYGTIPAGSTQAVIRISSHSSGAGEFEADAVYCVRVADLDDEVYDGSTYARTTISQRNGGGYAALGLTSSGNFQSGRLLGGDSGVVAYGGTANLGLGGSPIYDLDVFGGGSLGSNGICAHGVGVLSMLSDTSSGGLTFYQQSYSSNLYTAQYSVGTCTTINSSGNMGIGGSPATQFSVYGSGEIIAQGTAAAYVTYDRAGTGSQTVLYRDAGVGSIYDSAAGAVLLYNGSGQVGIGRAPSYQLEAAGQVRSVGSGTSGAGTALRVYDTDTSTETVLYRSSGISRLWDTSYGDVIRYNTSGNVSIGGSSPVSGYPLSVLGVGVIDTNSYIRASLGPYSTALNAQGNIPAKSLIDGWLSITTNAYSASAGTAQAAFTWSAFTIYRQDGSSISVPVSSSLVPVPPAPTLSSTSGGSLAARTYTVQTAYVRQGMLYGRSSGTSISLGADTLCHVSSPASVSGMDGWIPLVETGSATAEQYVTADCVASGKIVAISFGTAWTEPSTGYVASGPRLDLAPSPGTGSIWAPLLAPSTTYYVFPCINLLSGQIEMAGANPLTVITISAYAGQSKDGMICLSPEPVEFTTPASGGGGTGGGGGGGGGAGGGGTTF